MICNTCVSEGLGIGSNFGIQYLIQAPRCRVSLVQAAKRALVTLLFAFAHQYEVKLVISRESSDSDVVKAFRKVALKAHPDKGGRHGDAAKLNATREAWENAEKHSGAEVPPSSRGSARVVFVPFYILLCPCHSPNPSWLQNTFRTVVMPDISSCILLCNFTAPNHRRCKTCFVPATL